MPKIWDVTIRAPSGWWVIDDKSKAKIEGNSYRNLKHALIRHRKDNDLPWLDVEIEEMIHRQVCARESADYCRDIKSMKSAVHQKRNAATTWGPAKWAELHRAALTGQLNQKWFAAWMKSLPNKGCGCRSHFNAVMERTPIPTTFEQTVHIHNQVSKNLGKPQMSVEDARTRWSQ